MSFLWCLLLLLNIVSGEKYPTSGSRKTDIHKTSKVDIYPTAIKRPVEFGHIYKEGFEDPTSNLKQPIDVLELDMVDPKTHEDAAKLLNRKGKKPKVAYFKNSEKPKGFANPRDTLLYDAMGVKNKNHNDTPPMWFNYPTILQKNSQSPSSPKTMKDSEKNDQDLPAKNFFQGDTFELKSNIDDDRVKWTTCEEFAETPNFHPKDIVNIKWMPFFIWSRHIYIASFTHVFIYPTKKLVATYKEEFASMMNVSIDWNQPKLLLRAIHEMLLIAGDRKGLFYGIMKHEIPEYVKRNFKKDRYVHIPVRKLRLKIIATYLAMMYCDEDYTFIMAMLGYEPTTYQHRESEAKKLGFTGLGRPVFRDLEFEQQLKHHDNKSYWNNNENSYLNIDD